MTHEEIKIRLLTSGELKADTSSNAPECLAKALVPVSF